MGLEVREEESMVDDSGSGASERPDHEHEGGWKPSEESSLKAQGQTPPRKRTTVLRDRGTATAARVKASSAGTFWARLSAVDFMNSSLILGALALMSLLPFLTVLAAAAGGDIRRTIITRMGLNHEAAAAVERLISSGHRAVTTLSVFGGAWLVLGAFGISSTLQGWYRKVYDQPSSAGAAKVLAAQALWIAAFLAYITVQVLIGRHVGPFGRHVLPFVAAFTFAVIFWTFSAYVLLLGKVRWRALLPAGVATGICLTGLSVFSALLFSSSVVSGDQNYGPVGVVTALLSYFIGFGVCIHLGAVFGRMWNERHEAATPPGAATE
jgi:membrane protein